VPQTLPAFQEGESNPLLPQHIANPRKQLFILGIFLPVLPWVYAAAVFLFLPSVKVKDIEKQEEEGVVVVEGRYWAWVCVFGLAVEVLLAVVVGGIVLYDMGLLHG